MKQEKWQKLLLSFLALIALTLIVSCSDDDGGDSVATIGPEGGVVRSSDGNVTLVIPPGALAASQTITIGNRTIAVSREVSEDSLIDITYPLEPDGLRFLTPATISYSDGSEVPSDNLSDLIVLSNSDASGNNLLPNLTLTIDGDNGSLTASGSLSHFSRFIVKKVPRRAGISVGFTGVPSTSQVGKRETVEISIFKPRTSEFAANPVHFTDGSSNFLPVNDNDRFTTLAPLLLDQAAQNEKQIIYTCLRAGQGRFNGKVSFSPTSDSTKYFTAIDVNAEGIAE